MKKITIKDFHKEINRLVKESLRNSPPKKKPKSMSRSKGIRTGQCAEPAAENLLKKHPNVLKMDSQVRFRPVGGTARVDLVAYMKNGDTVYIPVARDIWRGTAQVDRMEKIYYKWKGGFWNGYNVCPLCCTDYKIRINKKFGDTAIRENLINEMLREMADNDKLFNIETLWEYLNNFKEKTDGRK